MTLRGRLLLLVCGLVGALCWAASLWRSLTTDDTLLSLALSGGAMGWYSFARWCWRDAEK